MHYLEILSSSFSNYSVVQTYQAVLLFHKAVAVGRFLETPRTAPVYYTHPYLPPNKCPFKMSLTNTKGVLFLKNLQIDMFPGL